MKSIFVSSTFQDMQKERDLIQLEILPELRSRIKAYGENLNMVDLRWGINTTELESEEGTKKILSVCLEQIDKCEPFIIVLIGERYGWIPNQETVKSTLDKKGLHHLASDKSITEMEIQYGALHNKNAKVLFYFREPVDTTFLPEELKSVYGPENDFQSRKLNSLKEEIREKFPEAVSTYSINWDPVRNNFNGLEAFKDQVVEDLFELIKTELTPIDQISWQDSELREAWRSIEDRSLRFSARSDLLKKIKDELQNDSQSILLYGDQGIGKSTLVSKLASDLEDEYRVFPILIGLTERSKNLNDILKTQLNHLEDLMKKDHLVVEDETRFNNADQSAYAFTEFHTTDSFENKFSNERLRKYLTKLLYEYAENNERPLLFIYDGIDQLPSEEQKQFLSILPSSLPYNAKILMTSTDQDSIPDQFYENSPLLKESIQKLSHSEVLEVIESTLRSQQKELDTQLIEELSHKKGVSNPLYLSFLLNRLMMLDNEDFDIIKAHGNDMTAINNYLRFIIQSSPEDLKGLIVSYFKEIADRINFDQSLFLLKLLTLTRQGLREQDLSGTYQLSGKQWNTLDFVRLQKYIKDYLIEKEDGRIDFSHRVIRKSLRDSLNKSEKQQFIQTIYQWIRDLPDDDLIKASEFYYYSRIVNQSEPFFDYIERLTDKEFKRITGSSWSLETDLYEIPLELLDHLDTRNLLTIGSEVFQIESENRDGWFIEMIRRSNDPRPGISDFIISKWFPNVNITLQNYELVKETLMTGRESLDKFTIEEDPFLQKWLRATYNEFLAECVLLKKNYREAVQYLNEAIKIRHEFAFMKGSALHFGVVAKSYQKRGKLYKQLGENDKALDDYLEGLYILEFLQENFSSPELSLDIAKAYINLGDLEYGIGELESAYEDFLKAMEILQKEIEDTNDTDLLHGLLEAFYGLSILDRELGRYDTALRYATNYHFLSKKLYKDRSTLNNRRKVAYGYTQLGIIYLTKGERREAINYLTTALKLQEEIYEQIQTPDIISALIQIRKARSLAYQQLYDFGNAIADLKFVHSVLDQLDFYEIDLEFYLQIVSSYFILGTIYIQTMNEAEAKTAFENGLEITDRYKDQFRSPYINLFLVRFYRGLGTIKLDSGEKEQGKNYLEKALILAKEADLELSTPDSLILLNAVRFSLAIYYEENEEIEKAKNNFFEIIKSFSEHPEWDENIEVEEILKGTYQFLVGIFSKERDEDSAAYYELKHQELTEKYSTLYKAEAESLKEAIDEFNLVTTQAMTDPETINWHRYKELKRIFYKNFEEENPVGLYFYCLSNQMLAEHENGKGNLQKAINYLEENVSLYEIYPKFLQNEYRQILYRDYMGIATYSFILETTEKAEYYFQKAIKEASDFYEVFQTESVLSDLINIINAYSLMLIEDRDLYRAEEPIIQAQTLLNSKTFSHKETYADLSYCNTFYLGRLFQFRDPSMALEYYLKAYELLETLVGYLPDYEMINRQNDLSYYLAQTEYELKQYTQAIEDISIALELRKEIFEEIHDLSTLLELIEAYYELLRYLKASNQISRLVEIKKEVQKLYNDFPQLLETSEFIEIKRKIDLL